MITHAQSKANQTTSHRPEKKRGAFVLLLALSMMSFVLVIVLSLMILVSVERASAAQLTERLLARENARLGIMVALGDLQKYAGPDQRVTARGDILSSANPGAEMWAGVWDSSATNTPTPVWLVSGNNPSPTTGPSAIKSAILFPATDTTPAVRADWVSLFSDNLSQGKFAYWVEDENVKARVNLADETDRMSYLSGPEQAQNIRESISQYPSQKKIFAELTSTIDGEKSLPKATAEMLGRAHSSSQVGLAFSSASSSNLLQNLQHHYTTYSATVLENSLSGGLKVNLTGRNQSELDTHLILTENQGDHYLKGDYLLYYNIDPTTGIPLANDADPDNLNASLSSLTSTGEMIRRPTTDFFGLKSSSVDPEDGEARVVRNIMPIVSEASFRLGAFHNQQSTDAKHRIRFHVDVEFWNPYPFPIRFPGEGQDRTFIVMLVPSELGDPSGAGAITAEKMILSIERFTAVDGTKLGELHTNLFDFDENLISILATDATGNTSDETVMSSWMKIEDVILQPGEVYHATTGQAEGLARELGGFILGLTGDPEHPEDYIVDPKHYYNKWAWETVTASSYPILNSTDRIRINLRMPENGLTFRLIAFDSNSFNQSPVYEEDITKQWAEPVFELRNIYKIENPPTLELTGAEYSRSSSGSYAMDNYNIGFHFRLMDDFILEADPSAINLGLGFDLRQPIWDYNNKAVKNAIMVGGIAPEDAATGVEPDPFGAPHQLDLFFNNLDVLADANPDTHSGTFQQAFFFPKPIGEPLSIGSFSKLPLTYETVSYDVDSDGTDESVQLRLGTPWGGSLNAAFDKYFFTGAPPAGWSPDQPLPLPAQVRLETSAAELRMFDAAKNILIRGGFNVNSLSPHAWAAMLSRTIYDWEYGTPLDPKTTTLENAHLVLGSTTDEVIRAIGGPSPDSALTSINPSELDASENAGRLAMRHPLRQLRDTQIYDPTTPADDSLVEFLLDELETHFATNPPFPTISAFVNSGVLTRAIQRSDINGSIARFSPAYISQAGMLEPIAPFLTVRSDTFVLHSLGEQVNPITGQTVSRIMCEAIVQRIPERVDGESARILEPSDSNGNVLGRSFVIKQIKWKEAAL